MADERIERMVWKRLGLQSTRQIAEELGISPEEVSRYKREFFEGVDELTIQQKRTKFLVSLEELAQDAREAYENATDERNKSGLLNSSVNAMKTIIGELNRMEKADTTKIDALNNLRIRELVSLIQEVVDTSVEELVEKYELDSDEIFSVFNRHLVEATKVRELE